MIDDNIPAPVVTASILSFVIAFWGCYIYCISEFGVLLGAGLGWIPAMMLAGAAAAAFYYVWLRFAFFVAPAIVVTTMFFIG